ncbi:hypothetical protein ACFXJ8_31625 [Nonomuraea sp. NPDC059194]|uniref:hypothetical protein n=1 Tax=Nonomuraea sp. NPDC059194 TaxID=3346764 RepID=UPI0036BDACCF
MFKSLLAATVILGGVLAAPSTANAAGYTPEGICGNGFAVVNKAPVGSLGTVYLLYNRRNGLNCAVTIKSKLQGLSTRTTVELRVARPAGNGTASYEEIDSDTGRFKYYAGPVKLQGKGMCVQFFGSMANGYAKSKMSYGGSKDWSNCG